MQMWLTASPVTSMIQHSWLHMKLLMHPLKPSSQLQLHLSQLINQTLIEVEAVASNES
jgi:hypothetical protein